MVSYSVAHSVLVPLSCYVPLGHCRVLQSTLLLLWERNQALCALLSPLIRLQTQIAHRIFSVPLCILVTGNEI